MTLSSRLPVLIATALPMAALAWAVGRAARRLRSIRLVPIPVPVRSRTSR